MWWDAQIDVFTNIAEKCMGLHAVQAEMTQCSYNIGLRNELKFLKSVGILDR